ncbi:hypothetical protein TcWFU_008506 [Taenia crassiceps]|uniref:Uncharacterized protein n=1 Tax=Taenia crassiceps TaxID=6207 RepID=A0ABR4Q0F4_9CEST
MCVWGHCVETNTTQRCRFCGTRICTACLHGDFVGVATDLERCVVCYSGNKFLEALPNPNWSRSHGPSLRPFSNDNNTVGMMDRKHFRYARPRVTFRRANQVPRGQSPFKIDAKSLEEWRIETNFNTINAAMRCQQEIKSPQYDFERIVTNLRGSQTPASINLSILLPPRQPWSRRQDQSSEESFKDDIADIETNWVRHLLALAKGKGFSLANQLYFGEITVTSQSASLLVILDLSPDNIITCPKLKVSLLKAKATEVQHAQREALLKAADSARHTMQVASRSPLLFFARNRVRHRRSETSMWSGASNESLVSSASVSLQRRRNVGRSVGGARSISRSGGRSGGRNSGKSRGGQLLTRKDSNLLASRPFRKRSIRSFHMAPRKSSISSNVSVHLDSDASESEGNTRLGLTLAYALRNQIRDLLIEEHECTATGCQDEGIVALGTDTAGYRVVTHVAVVEVMQQSIIMASQGLHEHRVDTYYSFTFKYQDAITVATVYLIRQFVKFPNVITTSNPMVRDVYERKELELTAWRGD